MRERKSARKSMKRKNLNTKASEKWRAAGEEFQCGKNTPTPGMLEGWRMRGEVKSRQLRVEEKGGI